jgi:hypothetical protein
MNGLPDEVNDINTAVQTLMEEIDAAYEYKERSRVCTDKRLKKILTQHGHDEEKHASILLEWLREKEKQPDVDFEKQHTLFK